MSVMILAITSLGDFGRWARREGLEIVLLVVGSLLLARFVAWFGARLTQRIDDNDEGSDAVVRSEAAKHRHSLTQVITGTVLVLIYSLTGVLVLQRFGVPLATLSVLFFGANLPSALSFLAAVPLARRFGLLNTMVFTHLPSNVLLILVPFMPNLSLAITVLLLRFSISQMDVPTRQSYVLSVVDESERTAAAGITGVARTTGAALAPVLAMPLIAGLSSQSIPFIAAGVLKIIYDLALLRSFRTTTARR
jgi:hypothetical protein